jgi:hypothetical protein
MQYLCLKEFIKPINTFPTENKIVYCRYRLELAHPLQITTQIPSPMKDGQNGPAKQAPPKNNNNNNRKQPNGNNKVRKAPNMNQRTAERE